jgi:hypothetical protein
VLRFASTILLSLFITASLNASNFKKCHQDVKKSYKFSQGKHLYHTRYGWLFFSDKPEKNYISYEPLLGLYILSPKDAHAQLKMLNRHPKDVAVLTNKTFEKKRIINEGLGIDRLALLDHSTYTGTALFGACCTLRAFAVGNELVTSDYLLHYLRNKQAFATAGIRFEKIKGKIIVVDVNPFFEFNPFKVGDEIIYFNGKKRSMDSLAKEILFSKVGSKHFFKVKRNGKLEGLSLYFKKRLGGGVLADTYLEHFGFRFNRDMKIVFIEKGSLASIRGLKAGDKLISLNNEVVLDDASLRKVVQKPFKKEQLRLLFERHGLAFNIYFPTKQMLTLQK